MADAATIPGGAGNWVARLPAPVATLAARPGALRAAVPALLVLALLLAAGLWLVLRAPERTPLFAGLPEADKAQVVAALEAGGLAVALDERTGAVLLPPRDHARARMMLAGQGLPRSAPGGAELIGTMPLGTSRAVEGARLKAAHERELAAAIEQLDGVEAARVMVATGEPSPFVRERAPVTAAVSLTLARGRTLSDAQARAIQHLVAGAVAGLAADRVAIADQTGRLIAGGSDGGADTAAAAERLRLKAALEARAREAILTLLTPVVGAGNVSAEVAIELDLAAREAAAERFDPEGALRSEQLRRETGVEPRAMGIPGALTNTVPAAAVVVEEPPVDAAPVIETRGSEETIRNWELGRTVEVTRSGGGQVRRLTAAVLIRADALGPPAGRAAVLAELKTLVEGAVGMDAARGDRVAIAARPFVETAPEPVPLWREPLVTDGARWLAAALVALALIWWVLRPAVERLRDVAAALADARDPPAAGLAGPAEGLALPPPPDYAAKLAQARLLAASDTARATAVARRLLAAEPAGAAPEAPGPPA
jgi:flagellar M-ring protein FliF